MSRFFVGQRVRVARNVGFQHPLLNAIVGQESAIASIGEVTGYHDGHDIALRDFTGICFHPSDLEPILPEGAAPSELSYTELMDRCKAGEVECV